MTSSANEETESTHDGVDSGHGVREHLHLEVLHDEVVAPVLQ